MIVSLIPVVRIKVIQNRGGAKVSLFPLALVFRRLHLSLAFSVASVGSPATS